MYRGCKHEDQDNPNDFCGRGDQTKLHDPNSRVLPSLTYATVYLQGGKLSVSYLDICAVATSYSIMMNDMERYSIINFVL